ncbi:uncharacterized protein LOC124297530 [Neodiprion virginianus]|uniref:uncharacterized protein LOC124297530 n=1 Tax=Neodiprion virginianus TaxID=2961670 RepID=UPI001EE6F4D7|nr:uncharacterized protein LOC124297530 [Neodiprion virginianus]
MSSCWHRLSWTQQISVMTITDPRFVCALLIVFVAALSTATPLPLSLPHLNQSSSTTVQSLLAAQNSSNSTENDLYVIKAVVYEIGILTDADNSTNDTTERHEEVNLSFYDPPHENNGLLDLSGIPLPQVVASTTNTEE